MMKYHFKTTYPWLKSKDRKKIMSGKMWRNSGPPYTAAGIVKWCGHYGKQSVSSSTSLT